MGGAKKNDSDGSTLSHKEKCKLYYQQNKDIRKQKAIDYYYQNQEKILKYKEGFRNENRQELNDKAITWRNANKDKVKATNQRIRKNKGYTKYYEIIKKEKRKHARPNWINKKEMIDLYSQCPDGYQVDHIIPIVNKNVCGLDTPCNIQFLPKEMNNFKRNSFDFTQDNESWRIRYKKLK